MTDATPQLRLYIEYEYLAAQQLGELLAQLHLLFDELQYAEAPYLRQLSSTPAARLRVASAATGESITVYLAQGIMQLVKSSDPALTTIVGGTTGLVVLGRLLIPLLNRIGALRAQWRRDNRTDEYQRLQVTEKEIEVKGKEFELRQHIEAQQARQIMLQETMEILTEQFPARTAVQREELAAHLQPHLDAFIRTASEPNIRRVEVTLPAQDE